MQTHLPLYQKMGEVVSRCGGVKLRQDICLSFNISYGNDNQSPYTEPTYCLSVHMSEESVLKGATFLIEHWPFSFTYVLCISGFSSSNNRFRQLDLSVRFFA